MVRCTKSKHVVRPVKITALAGVSIEALQDFNYFAQFVLLPDPAGGSLPGMPIGHQSIRQ
jgi:hypothetical protein